jgi:hypothetical protein
VNWHNWNRDSDNPNGREDDCAADLEPDIEQENGIEDPECPEQQDVRATPNVPGLIWLTCESKGLEDNVGVMVNAIKMRRNTGVKKK